MDILTTAPRLLYMSSEITVEEIPVDRAEEFWEIHFKYLVDDGIISDEEDKEYFWGVKDDSSESKQHIRYGREGQDEYRRKLLEECPFCPITMINEESLLIASHIKPWAVSDSIERTDFSVERSVAIRCLHCYIHSKYLAFPCIISTIFSQYYDNIQ